MQKINKMNKHILAVLAAGIAALIIGFGSCDTGANPAAEDAKEALRGTVAITGTAKAGETLTANISGVTNGTGTAAYQWKRGNDVITGAAGSTYVVADADEGKTITLVVSFSGNNGSLTSAATTAVQPKDQTKETLQGTVAITGTAQTGEVLTADISGITNSSGSVSYQWKRGGQDIAGAAGVTYTLANADKGTTITVTVSYSGNSGSLTSAPTPAVASEQKLYGKIDNVFNVFQDDGVSDDQMAASFANLKEGYDLLVDYHKKTEGITDPLLGKITEIHIIADKNWTWDDNTKILGIKQGMGTGNCRTILEAVYDGDIPPMAQMQKSANGRAEALDCDTKLVEGGRQEKPFEMT
jgi:hypothetical protein